MAGRRELKTEGLLRDNRHLMSYVLRLISHGILSFIWTHRLGVPDLGTLYLVPKSLLWILATG